MFWAALCLGSSLKAWSPSLPRLLLSGCTAPPPPSSVPVFSSFSDILISSVARTRSRTLLAVEKWDKLRTAQEIEWLDEWEYTNKLPTVVELTLYLQPMKEGDEPVEVKRIIGIPVAELGWR